MSQAAVVSYQQLALPTSLVSKLDVARVLSELEQLDSDLAAVAARAKAGVKSEFNPVISEQLRDIIQINQLRVEDPSRRTNLINQLRQLKDQAPVVHMTFASNADMDSLGQLVGWLRQSVHPQSLIVLGLQPSLIGGVYIRTSNQVHDFSVRGRLSGARHLLVEAVEAVSGVR